MKVHTLLSMWHEHDALRAAGKTLVACSGSFDLLHEGHRALLQKCRAHGDALLVLLNSDDSVRLYKGPRRPIDSFEKRAANLAALPYVDYVVGFSELNPLEALRVLQPEIYCNGVEWGKECIEREVVEEYGGVLKIVDSGSSVHTSQAVREIYGVTERERRAVFLDRDGVIIEDSGYVHRKEDMRMLPRVSDALKSLRIDGWELYVVSNQSGVGRGMYTEEDVKRLHEELAEELARDGVTIDGFYYCPHHPDSGCRCRKPGVGLFEQAAREHGIALGKSWMVGDRESDIRAGRYANMKTIYIDSARKGADTWAIRPHVEVADIAEAAAAIVRYPR